MTGSRRRKGMSHAQIMALGFIMVIMAGTFLLMLPIASKTGTVTHFFDCLFTSVSATCVTGLVVVDTFNHWTLFGQIVILVMIQIGGLGIITISAIVYTVFRRRIGLNMRNMIQESIYAFQLDGITNTLKRIFRRTIIIEMIGAAVLCSRFIPQLGVAKGIWYGIFHSISAFCNAGFDLMGRFGAYSSLTTVKNDPVILITLMALVLIGGLGFVVWDDIIDKKFKIRKYSLHSKVVLIMLVSLVAGGTVLYLIFERDNLFAGMSPGERLLSAVFASVTPRTAGFNSIDVEGMTQASKILTCILMFIGGNSGSTAGGIKTTTVVVMGAYIFSSLARTTGTSVLKRRIGDENIKTASMVFGLNLSILVSALLVISCVQRLPLDDVLLEVFSAMGTVGLSAGITRSLLPVSKIILMIMMFSGRIGTVTFAVTFKSNKRKAFIKYPEERINVG